MSRALGGDMVEELCKYMDVSRDAVFRYTAPLDLSFLFQIQDVLRQRTELFYPKRFPQRSPQFVSGEPILPQIRQKEHGPTASSSGGYGRSCLCWNSF